MLHKGAQKRIYFEGATYFVTNHVVNWHRFFSEPIFCEVFMANLELCKLMKKFDLYAFIIILHHFHLLFRPDKAEDLSKIVQFLKRNVTRNINFVMGFTVEGAINESLLRLEDSTEDSALKKVNLRVVGKLKIPKANESLPRLGGDYKIYEEELKKHYVHLNNLRVQFVDKYGLNQNKFPKFHWEKSFRDHYIRSQKDFDEHVRYIQENPMKHKIEDPLNYNYIFTKYPDLISEY
jgi:REP element-mobilizing transposase RayT